MHKFLILFLLFISLSFSQTTKPSIWWIHGPVAAHITFAALDGLSSWKQRESNIFYQQPVGLYAGDFYRTGAIRLTSATLSIAAISELIGFIHPKWRKYIGILNLGAASAHFGTTLYNIDKNPYYR
jgi:hypothetical protein